MRSALIAILLSAVCWAGQDRAARITLREGFPFIEARINGRGPFRLLIDTGAGSSMLSPEAARKAGLTLDHRVMLTSLAGEKVIPASSDNHVEAGGVLRSGVAILVADMGQVRRLDLAADGVLGQTFLSQSAYLIDYERKKLWLGDEATARADRLPIEVSGVELHGRTVLPVKLEWNGKPWRLTLDSGATHLIVACNENCPGLRGVRKDSLLATHVGEHPVARGMLKQLEIGGVAMPAAEAVLLDTPAPPGWGWDGVLPARWFSAIYVNRSVVRLALSEGAPAF